MRNNKIAIMYDFDKTLCTKDMQEYSFIPNLGMKADIFWEEATKLRINEKMDSVLAYMYLMSNMMREKNTPLTRKYLNDMGKNIELFNGVETWFKRINNYAKKYNMEIEHYIISSGIKEIIEGSVVGKYFKCIYASEFYYDKNGYAIWPKLAINYTNKTQFLKRINKGVLDVSDDYNINRKMDENDKYILDSNMIYIGDGITDVPCMKLTKDGGGVSIAVYTDKNVSTVKKLKNDERINYIAKANYTEGSQLDIIVKKTIKSMSLNSQLKELAKNE